MKNAKQSSLLNQTLLSLLLLSLFLFAITGNDVGEVMEHFEAVDQFGEIVSSYDFCNRTLLLASGAFW